jgi:hypothetical protein
MNVYSDLNTTQDTLKHNLYQNITWGQTDGFKC